MKLVTLISSMNSTPKLAEALNAKGDVIIINQSDTDSVIEEKSSNAQIKFISSTDRGLSKSRNLAVNSSTQDICLISDDDVKFLDDYREKILEAYQKFEDADIIAFRVDSSTKDRPLNILKNGRVNRVMSMKIASVQISFKRNSFIQNKLFFDERFGAGSGLYTNGEENIMLYKAIKNGLKVYFCDSKIADVSSEDSTWYGINPELNIKTKGAMFYEMSSILYPLYNLQFVIRKKGQFDNNFGLIKAIKIIFSGSKEIKHLD